MLWEQPWRGKIQDFGDWSGLCPAANPESLKSLLQLRHKVGMNPIFPELPAAAEGLLPVWEMNPTILPSSQIVPTHLIPHLTPPHGMFSLCPSSLVITRKDFCSLSRFSWISTGKVWMMLPNISIGAPLLLFLQSQKSIAGKVPATFPNPIFMEWKQAHDPTLPPRSYLGVKHSNSTERESWPIFYWDFHVPSGIHLWNSRWIVPKHLVALSREISVDSWWISFRNIQ